MFPFLFIVNIRDLITTLILTRYRMHIKTECKNNIKQNKTQ